MWFWPGNYLSDFEIRRLGRIAERVQNLSKKLVLNNLNIYSEIGIELFHASILLRETITKSMWNTPKAGNRYPRPGGRYHIASAPGNPPSIDFGNLVKAITYTVRERKMEAEIGALASQSGRRKGKLPIGRWMEKGTRGLGISTGIVAPRPWLEPAVNQKMDFILNRIRLKTIDLIDKPFKDTLEKTNLYTG